MRRDDTDREVNIRVNLYDLSEITVIVGSYAYVVPAVMQGLKHRDYWTWTAVAYCLDLTDAENTERTQEQLDDALLAVDAAGEATRAATNLGSPIPTAKHFAAVDRQITRAIEIVKESEFVADARKQDFSHSSFLAEAWGLSDEPEPDDLDVPASDIAKAEAEEADRAARKKKRKKPQRPAGAAAEPDSRSDRDDFYNQF
jgi:putative transposase